ncbi:MULTISPECIES: hypothetical protein [unclassified Leisingera]|uniref:hypothetical protein n=1 Tax=unclassified Leisingera TaxID=2614906 RepID=UPI0002FE9311|nr:MULTISPECIES: hypothetical protein [unclassified Leisingera]KIC19317.1 hypothetical protein RA21_02075 [Leisingera sp. ANG-DT]KIC26663.1 hypothetical protein RA23_02730 [Leisingera sp. ANG-S3]KIC33706.1 hypothetical protein RA25_06995 [Leisingera sp. ANG-S5]KIC53890.1 hypothetical protein RA22_09315 [Leisingera sp. ANG-S]KID10379.1 hypothetical protein GC1_01435 [Leisingera sp. ANG1]
MQKFLTAAAAAAMTLSLVPAATHAGPPKWAPGHSKSAAHYAPGQVKKRHHRKHSHDHDHDHDHDRYDGRIRGDDWVYIDDYGRWGLNPPREGHRYVRQGDKIFEVVKDTLAIIGAVAVVNALTQ